MANLAHRDKPRRRALRNHVAPQRVGPTEGFRNLDLRYPRRQALPESAKCAEIVFFLDK